MFFINAINALNALEEQKFDRSTDEVIIIENCNKHFNHENWSYEQFIKLYKKNEFSKIYYDIKKYHRFYIQCMLSNNEYKDIPSTIEKFEKETKKLFY